jgi:ribonuclease R
LKDFVRACGFQVSGDLTRKDMQALIERVRGRPESYAVNLALLKMMMQAEYSPRRVGHFALASDAYCHFTSPIRRYPDLTVHRLLDEHLRGRLEMEAAPNVADLVALGEHCSFTERRAAEAERELRLLLVLQMLQDHIGEVLEGVVTGITGFGIFIESSKYLVEGLVRIQDLGDDWWEANPKAGVVVAQRTGKQIRMGDAVAVRINAVDLGRRQLDLRIERFPTRQVAPAAKEKGKKKEEGKAAKAGKHKQPGRGRGKRRRRGGK